MKKWIKYKLKDWFLILKVRNRLSPDVQINQVQLYQKYRQNMADNNLPLLKDTGFRVFSQFEEDGLLLYIFSLIGMTHKTFIEIGSDDGVNSNSANLYFHFGWHGLFLDGNAKSIKRGKKFFSKYPHPWFYKPTFMNAMITRKNINELITKANLKGEIGFLSIDIDGNDYWIWDAIDVVEPQVVMIETHIEFGLNNIVVPYDENYVYPGKHPIYHGASPVAMVNLAKRKGYRLVGANQYGFNLIFVKNGLVDGLIPEVKVETLLTHPSYYECLKKFEPIKDWEYEEG